MMATAVNIASQSDADTRRIGEALGTQLQAGHIIALVGELGSGKTTFVKGLARGLGIPDERMVKSPTFTLVHEYPARVPLIHCDLYRLDTTSDVEGIGIDEYFNAPNIVVIEWAKTIPGYLPLEHLEVQLAFSHLEMTRDIRIIPHGTAYEQLLIQCVF